jgi:hypothetical protein
MKTATAIGGGLAGACAVTLIHETIKRVVPEPPRMDLLGMNAISKGLKKSGMNMPDEKRLFTIALAGDLFTNALYYSLAGIGKDKNAWLKGSLFGLAAGIGAVMLPGPLGLNASASNRTPATKLMTIGLYVAGGLVATAVFKLLEKRKQERYNQWEHRLMTSAMG